MADDRDSLLREVDEELRREQMEKLWQRYNGVILAGAALIVAGVAGYKYLESRRMSAAESAGAAFNAAVKLADESKTDDAIKAFEEIAKTGPRGYASLAKLHVAGALAKAGKQAEAVTAYESLANDGSADQLLKNFAQLQAASLRMGEADFTEMQNRLNSLTGDQSPFKVVMAKIAAAELAAAPAATPAATPAAAPAAAAPAGDKPAEPAAGEAKPEAGKDATPAAGAAAPEQK